MGFPSLNRYKEKCFLVKPLMRELNAAGQLTGPSAKLMESPPAELRYDTYYCLTAYQKSRPGIYDPERPFYFPSLTNLVVKSKRKT